MKVSNVNIRGVEFKLNTYTRSLELCSRMNYEQDVLDFIDLIPEGSIFYDLGACEGRFSLYAAAKGLKTYSFEPEQMNFKVLSENAQINPLIRGNLFLSNVGVGNRNGSATMQVGQPWEGGHQKIIKTEITRQDLSFDFTEEQEVSIITLDSFVLDKPFPNYMKIDIDGSELVFLEGAEQTLKNSKLKAIIFELNAKDDNYIKIVKFLSSCGFHEVRRNQVENEKDLYNIFFSK